MSEMPVSLSGALTALVVEAEACGHVVTVDDFGLSIVKATVRGGKRRIVSGVRVQTTETGLFSYAYRLDVDPALATSIRTIRGTRAALTLR